MPAVISDTGPLNYLILIDATEILHKLFSSVLLPESVRKELLHRKAPAVVQAWMNDPPPWVNIKKLSSPVRQSLSHLHPGESEVITLAMEYSQAIVLMDDRVAVVEARSRELEVIGTLAILDRAAAKGFLDLQDSVRRLRATSFRSPRQLIARMLEQDALRKK